MTVASLDLRGDRELQQKLSRLKTRTAKTIARKAVNAAGTPIVKATRRNLSGVSKTLKKGVAKRTGKRDDGKPGYQVNVGAKRRKLVNGKYVARLWHLVDQDTAPRIVGPRHADQRLTFPVGDGYRSPRFVRHPGTRGKEFLAQSFRQASPEAQRDLREKLATEIIAEAKKK